MEMNMSISRIAKSALVAATLVTGVLSAPAAWAGQWHGGWHGGWGGPRFLVGGPLYYGPAYGGCYVRRLVPTPWGPRWRLINRCY